MKKELLASILIWLVCFSIAFVVAAGFPQEVAGAQDLQSGMPVFLEVFPRNLLVLLVLMIGAITFGAMTTFQLVWLAFIFGVESGLYVATFGWASWCRLIGAHAPLEMIAFILVAASALRIGREALGNLLDGSWRVRTSSLRSFVTTGVVGVSLLITAGLLEAYVTPLFLEGVQ